MAHLDSGSKSRADKTPKEWLKVGAQIGQVANKWAGRDDLIAYVGEGAGSGSPACYIPAIAEIEVNLDIAFGSEVLPNEVGDMRESKTQYEFPRATGAIIHEAFHAKFSNWSMVQASKDLSRAEYDALNLLEEGRIENQGLLGNKKARVFLRACAMDIVIGDMDSAPATQLSTVTLTNLVGLVHARVDSGILSEREVEKVITLCDKELTTEIVDKLRDISSRARAHTNHKDATDLYPLAKEWVEVMKEVAEERGEDLDEGKGTPISPDMLEELMDALEDAGVDVDINNFNDISDEEAKEEVAKEVEAKNKISERRGKAKDVAGEIFSKSSGDTSGLTMSILKEKRPPSPEERSSAVRIGQALEKAKYRERDVTERESEVPPGRLRTRAILQNSAMRARGVMGTAKPFRKTVRKHTDDPTLSIGVMVDISGSMGSAMESMASTAWIMAEAGYRVQAKTAMVYYGKSVFPTLKVGERLSAVSVYTAPDGTEKFGKAFDALNGILDLVHGRGARLLVIVSDGEYTYEELDKCREAIAECKENGVAVLWLPFDGGHRAEQLGGGYAEVVKDIRNPTDASDRIAESATRVLTKIGQRA